jgi:branched-chain amino acid transport system ATP-binding protein
MAQEQAKKESILEIKKLYFYYGKAKALEEINLTINKSEITAIIGPNGAGKSTLLRVISGLEKIDRGKITFFPPEVEKRGNKVVLDERIDEMEAHEITKLGIVQCPERRRLFYNMTVIENLMLGAFTVKDRSIINQQLNFVYELFPRLKERTRQRSGTLSGGEQQMLAIGRAIMAKPKLLLLDEPSLGLSPQVKLEIFDAIKKINKTMGTTTLLTEQDAVLAINNADYIHVLEDGKIEMRGTRQELEKEPRIKKVYLGI